MGCVLHCSPSFFNIWLVNVARHAYFQHLLVYTSNVEHETYIRALGVVARQHLHSVRIVIHRKALCSTTCGWLDCRVGMQQLWLI